MMTALAEPGREWPLYLHAVVPAGRTPMGNRSGLPEGVRVIEGKRFSAVVGGMPEKDLSGHDRRSLAHLLLAHQKIVEEIMTVTPVLPVKFGTVAPDRESVERCLGGGAEELAAAFARLEGKVQFEILVTWDLDALFREIAAEKAVAALKTELAMAGGSGDRNGRIRLGELVKQSLERRRAELSMRLCEALREMAVDSVANPLMDDRMVLNLALLVKADEISHLDRCLESLDAAYGGQLTFRCVGPLPPHSFATVEIVFLSKDEIDRARSALELDTVPDPEEVRFAFHRAAKRAHPDLGGAGNGDGRTMALLNDAYRILSTYAEAGGPAIVSVRRQQAAPGTGVAATVG